MQLWIEPTLGRPLGESTQCIHRVINLAERAGYFDRSLDMAVAGQQQANDDDQYGDDQQGNQQFKNTRHSGPLQDLIDRRPISPSRSPLSGERSLGPTY